MPTTLHIMVNQTLHPVNHPETVLLIVSAIGLLYVARRPMARRHLHAWVAAPAIVAAAAAVASLRAPAPWVIAATAVLAGVGIIAVATRAGLRVPDRAAIVGRGAAR